MHRTVQEISSSRFRRSTAPFSLAVGMAMLLVHSISVSAPVATGFALIALGASITMVSRSVHPAAILGQLLVYVCLYLLCVGAICDQGVRMSENGVSIAQLIDLTLGAGIMAFVTRLCLSALADGLNTPSR